MATSPGSNLDLPPHSENVEEELNRICLALEAVFSPSDHHSSMSAGGGSPLRVDNHWWERRQLADRYLTSFQSTSISWMVCDQLLLQRQPQQQQQQTVEATMAAANVLSQRRFFAAQTLMTKCRSDVYQLPEASLPSLRDSLVDHMTRYVQWSEVSSSTSPSALTTRLAMAISALAVQMGWFSIVTDLLGALQQQQQHQAANNGNNSSNSESGNPDELRAFVILLILRSLPEECASDRLVLENENLRYEMRDQLIHNSALVFQFFQANISQQQQQQPNPKKQNLVLEALHSWIKYVPVAPTAIVETPLLDFVVHALGSQVLLLEIGADVLVEIFRMYPSNHEANEVLVRRMVPLVLGGLPLEQILSASSLSSQPQASLDPQQQQQQEDAQRAYCRIITEMGESYMTNILSIDDAFHGTESNWASQFVEWVLHCSSIAELEIASITLHFWYRLVMELEQIEPYQLRQELVDNFAPLLLRLMDVCCTHLLRLPDNLEELSDDQVDDIHRTRFYVAETIDDCCRLLGGQVILQRIGNNLQQECQRISQQQQQQQQQQLQGTVPTKIMEWRGIESCLFAIYCMNDFISRDEGEYLSLCFSLIDQLPPNVWPLRFTTTLFIGRFASWLALHPEKLSTIWPYLRHSLAVSQCSSAAATAIKQLCGPSSSSSSSSASNSHQRLPVGDAVVQLYGEILSSPGKVELKDELEILQGLCNSLSDQIRAGVTTPQSGQLIQTISDRFTARVADANASARSIGAELDRLIVVVRFLVLLPPGGLMALMQQQQPHPMVRIMSSLWNQLDATAKRFSNDGNIAEKICRLHKHALRSTGAVAYASMLDSLLEQLVSNFHNSHQSPYLYAGSICITEYGANAKYVDRLFRMIEAMATTAFTFLRNLDDLTRHPDVVEELFYLMGRVVVHCPAPLLANTSLLRSLLQCVVVGLQLDHKDANRGTLNFLENVMAHGLSLRTQLQQLQQPPQPQPQQQQESQQQQAQAQNQRQQQLLNVAQDITLLEEALRHEGQGIVTSLGRALMGELPAYGVDSTSSQGSLLAGIIYKFHQLYPHWVLVWMQAALAAAPDRPRAEFLAVLEHSSSSSTSSSGSNNNSNNSGGGMATSDFNLAVRVFMSACDRHLRRRPR